MASSPQPQTDETVDGDTIELGVIYDRSPFMDCEEIAGSISLHESEKSLVLPAWIANQDGSQKYRLPKFDGSIDASWFSFGHVRNVIEEAWRDEDTIPSFHFAVDRDVLGISTRVPIMRGQERMKRLDQSAPEVFVKADGGGSIKEGQALILAAKKESRDAASDGGHQGSFAFKNRKGSRVSNNKGASARLSSLGSPGKFSRPLRMSSTQASYVAEFQPWIIFLLDPVRASAATGSGQAQKRRKRSSASAPILEPSPKSEILDLFRDRSKRKFSKGLTPMGEIISEVGASFADLRELIERELRDKNLAYESFLKELPAKYQFLSFPSDIRVSDLITVGHETSAIKIKAVKSSKEAACPVSKCNEVVNGLSAPVFIRAVLDEEALDPTNARSKRSESTMCSIS